MKLTEKQYKRFSKLLEDCGYKKRDFGSARHSVNQVCSNENFHWWKKIKPHAYVHICFWDHFTYPEENDVFRYGTQLHVMIYGDEHYSGYDFPFFQDNNGNTIFADYSVIKSPYLIERETTDTEMMALIGIIEQVARECAGFYQTKIEPLQKMNLRGMSIERVIAENRDVLTRIKEKGD